MATLQLALTVALIASFAVYMWTGRRYRISCARLAYTRALLDAFEVVRKHGSDTHGVLVGIGGLVRRIESDERWDPSADQREVV